jgi:hypothetical protein
MNEESTGRMVDVQRIYRRKGLFHRESPAHERRIYRRNWIHQGITSSFMEADSDRQDQNEGKILQTFPESVTPNAFHECNLFTNKIQI